MPAHTSRINGASLPSRAAPAMSINQTDAWQALTRHADAIRPTHLRELVADPRRCALLTAEHDGISTTCTGPTPAPWP